VKAIHQTRVFRRWAAWTIVALLSLGGGMTLWASAAPQPAREKKKATSVRQPKQVQVTGPRESKRIITGSHIPREVRRMGQTADTPFPIHILDSRDIERSGAATVAEALRRVPAVR